MWYYEKNGSQAGPVPIEQVLELIFSGDINRDTEVWKDGMSDWSPVDQTELSQFLPATPTPLSGEPPPLSPKGPPPLSENSRPPPLVASTHTSPGQSVGASDKSGSTPKKGMSSDAAGVLATVAAIIVFLVCLGIATSANMKGPGYIISVGLAVGTWKLVNSKCTGQ